MAVELAEPQVMPAATEVVDAPPSGEAAKPEVHEFGADVLRIVGETSPVLPAVLRGLRRYAGY